MNRKVLSTEIPAIAEIMTKNQNEVYTVIIGAGIAGLSAAHHLIKNGFKRTVILEATNRYGGRINSKKFGDACCELGAKWITIDASKNSMFDLLRHMDGLQKRVKIKDDTVYRNTKGELIQQHLPISIDSYFRKLCNASDLQDRVRKGQVQDLNNVHTYLQAEIDRIASTMYKKKDRSTVQNVFFSLMNEFGGTLGCNLENLNVEQLLKCRTHYTYPIYIPNGLTNILQDIMANIDEHHLRIGQPVGEICWFNYDDNESTKRIVYCLDGTILLADHIICTLPLGVLKTFASHMFKPKLPEEKMAAIANLGYGCPVKIYFEYKKDVKQWFRKNLRPLWSSEERKGNLRWTKQVVEIAKMPTSNRVLEITIGGAFYDEIEKLPDSVVSTEITKLLRECLNDSSVPPPYEILRSDWNSSACYMGGRPYFSTSSSNRDIQCLAAPLGNKPSLMFAGDATILSGFGTLDGARVSGIREAQRIIDFYRSLPAEATVNKGG